MTKFLRLFHTVKYLKAIQIYFRLFYFIRNKYRKKTGFSYPLSKESRSYPLHLEPSIQSHLCYTDDTFAFLNLSKRFDGEIDWNYKSYGKLWTYNLAYFDYLAEESHITLIHQFIDNMEELKDPLEPFPISLRGINWIKFLTYFSLRDKKIEDSLYAQYDILLDNLEYHLLGNHLMENGFSLLFGAYYFHDEILYAKAKEILQYELNEQVLRDGAHFELSPMYHQIMLYRVLDCINLIKNNGYQNQELLPLLTHKASAMLGWLENITYRNGTIPMLNDSAEKVAPSSNELFAYAKRLEIQPQSLPLSESGYRKIERGSYECLIDIGKIGPDYIPGHAHADTLHFELQLNLIPFIVDCGTSTYEANERRTVERSTSSHNTVTVNEKNSSHVWGGFRVAQRAKIIDLHEDTDHITAAHDGYQFIGILHTRIWSFNDTEIRIEDTLNQEADAVARLHFHPDASKEDVITRVKSNHPMIFSTYSYAVQFNQLQEAICIEIPFRQNLIVEIRTHP
jgi:hypothetical protein